MRTPAIALLGALTLLGCRDMGLEYNLPLEEAQNRGPSELVAAVMAPAASMDFELVVDGRLWVPSGLPLTLRSGELRPVGAAAGRSVYARAWDGPPYDALFTPLPPSFPADSVAAGRMETRQWIELAPVIGRSGRVPSVGPVDAGSHAEPDEADASTAH